MHPDYGTHIARELLKEAARLRTTVQYLILAKYAGYPNRFALPRLLQEILEVDKQLNLPPLFVLVVNKHTGQPAEDCVEHLRKHCVIPKEYNTPEKIIVFFQMICFGHYRGDHTYFGKIYL